MGKTNKVKEWYDTIAGEYKGHHSRKIDEMYYDALYVKYVYQLTGLKDERVLDLGCGTGRLTKRIASSAHRTVGIDFSFEILKVALGDLQGAAELAQMDANSMGFKDSSFDAVTAIGSMECHRDLSKVLGEVHRVLKPGGIFIFAAHNDVLYARIYRMLFRGRTGKAEYFKTNRYTLSQLKEHLEGARLIFKDYRATYFFPVDLLSRFGDGAVSRFLFKVATGLSEVFNKLGFTKRFGSVYIIAALK